MERLQKYISRCGYASRRKAEELILAGKVQVNGRYIKELGTSIEPDRDRVKVEGELLQPEALAYVLFNKPKGIITSVGDPEGRPTVMDYMKDIKTRLYPVGRLDYNTEGLLLLTNDGELAQKLMHPSMGVEKTYEIRLKGRVNDDHLTSISEGVPLEEGPTSPAVLVDEGFDVKTGLTTIEITIHEGRNRQVRRMFEHYGYTVNNLKRIAYAGLTLAGVKRGAHRLLTAEEIRRLTGRPVRTNGAAAVQRTSRAGQSKKSSLRSGRRAKSSLNKPLDKSFRGRASSENSRKPRSGK